MFRPLSLVFPFLLLASPLFAGSEIESSDRVIVSVREQKMMLVRNGAKVATYPVSTSKFGIGDRRGSMTTPLGYLQVARKIGGNAPVGAVFHHRRFTGEILKPNAPGRDPIITRILWLRGLEPWNSQAFSRCIYIHGTPEEKTIGRPASYGCIRMKSRDVTKLYDQLSPGALVQIVPDRFPSLRKLAGGATLADEAANARGEKLTLSKVPGKPANSTLRKSATTASQRLAIRKA